MTRMLPVTQPPFQSLDITAIWQIIPSGHRGLCVNKSLQESTLAE